MQLYLRCLTVVGAKLLMQGGTDVADKRLIAQKNQSATGGKDGADHSPRLPQVDKLLRHPDMKEREKTFRRECLTILTRSVLEEIRQGALHSEDTQQTVVGLGVGDNDGQTLRVDEDAIVRRVLALADDLVQGSLRRVINGTGVILNTNLGRAPLPVALVERLVDILPGYSSLEVNLENGQRGERIGAVERLLTVLTGCEAAIVVNNNAAAVLLLVNALAAGREVVISRGELIEIGGSFRLPDVIVSGGAILKEVGTTNRTRISDYRAAISDKTALLLKCHRSNFEISGFTEEANPSELADLARSANIPLVEDLGSGALIDLSLLHLKHEPTVQETLANADVVLFSGDKLLGGSQAGLIVGRRELINKLRKHPTYRALRLDKLNIALLEQTLAEYLHPEAIARLPVYEMAALSVEALQSRASQLVARLTPRLNVLTCVGVETESAFGGGTMPNVTIKSYGLKIDTANGARVSASKIGTALRAHRRPIVAIISSESTIIDLRTVSVSEDMEIEAALAELDDRLRSVASKFAG